MPSFKSKEDLANTLTADPDFNSLPDNEQDQVFKTLVQEHGLDNPPRSSIMSTLGEMGLTPIGPKLKEAPKIALNLGNAVTAGIFGSPYTQWLGGTEGGIVGPAYRRAQTLAAPIETLGGKAFDIFGQGAGTMLGAPGLAGERVGVGVAERLGSRAAGLLGKSLVRAAEGVTVGGLSDVSDSPINIALRAGLVGLANPALAPVVEQGANLVKMGVKSVGRAFGVPGGVTERVLARGTENVVKPEYADLSTAAAKVQTGVQKYKELEDYAYAAAKKAVRPQLDQTPIAGKHVFETWKQNLIDEGLVTPAGKPTPSILGEEISTDVEKSRATLAKIVDRTQRLMDEQGRIPASKALQLKDELDNLVQYDSNGVKKIDDYTAAMIKQLRHSLRLSIDQAVPDLATANARRASFYDVYHDMQPRLKDANIESTLHSVLNSRNTFNLRNLQAIDDALPVEHKFMETVRDAVAGTSLMREPTAHESLLRAFLTPQLFAKYLLPIGRGVLKTGETVAGGVTKTAPVLPASVATLLRQIGLSQDQSQDQ